VRAARRRLDTTPGGRLVFHVLAALAEFIREPIVSGIREDPAATRGRGRIAARPTVVTPEIICAAGDLLSNPVAAIIGVAALLGVSPGTLYNRNPRPTPVARLRRALPAVGRRRQRRLYRVPPVKPAGDRADHRPGWLWAAWGEASRVRKGEHRGYHTHPYR
jgi:hypothetical protein